MQLLSAKSVAVAAAYIVNQNGAGIFIITGAIGRVPWQTAKTPFFPPMAPNSAVKIIDARRFDGFRKSLVIQI
jgi:hypothetical protein